MTGYFGHSYRKGLMNLNFDAVMIIEKALGDPLTIVGAWLEFALAPHVSARERFRTLIMQDRVRMMEFLLTHVVATDDDDGKQGAYHWFIRSSKMADVIVANYRRVLFRHEQIELFIVLCSRFGCEKYGRMYLNYVIANDDTLLKRFIWGESTTVAAQNIFSLLVSVKDCSDEYIRDVIGYFFHLLSLDQMMSCTFLGENRIRIPCLHAEVRHAFPSTFASRLSSACATCV